MRWQFAANMGGRDAGLNDPGVQTFRGNFYRYLARELIQNSMDARLDHTKPVRVTFSQLVLRPTDVPDVKGLRNAISRCVEFWSHRQKEVALLERGLSSLTGPEVLCLKVSDFNTRGVTGGDEERDKDWYNLVRCAGSSSKSGGEGGSYGIGKNAPFAASLARTVLYSTRTSRNSVAFQGVSLLATHTDAHGTKRQPIGFLGNNDGSAVREAKAIPSQFLRGDLGTDIWIIGYPVSRDWQTDLMYSVLESFWPAISFGDLKVDIGSVEVTKENLPTKLAEFSTERDFTGHIYYRTYTEPNLQEHPEVTALGPCSIYVKSDDTLSTKKVAMIRSSGMVVTQRPFRWPMPFAGVFICRNEKGNARLREMEPPRHDDWDPNYPEPGANRKIHDAIGAAVREVIHQLNPIDDTEAISVPDLERFLPDLAGDNSIGLWDDGETSEGAVGVVRPEFHVKQIPLQSRSLPGSTVTATAEETEDGDPETPEKDGDGIPDDTAAERTPRREDEKGLRDGRASRVVIPTRSRAFIVDERAGKYFIALHPLEQSNNAYIATWAVGEDERSPLEVVRAQLSSGLELPLEGGSIGPMPITPEQPLEIELFLEPGARYALEVTASEAN